MRAAKIDGVPNLCNNCIIKNRKKDPCKRIARLVGNLWNEGKDFPEWSFTHDEIMERLRSGRFKYHTYVEGRRYDIGIVHGPTGPYLSTHLDGLWNDKLLYVHGPCKKIPDLEWGRPP